MKKIVGIFVFCSITLQTVALEQDLKNLLQSLENLTQQLTKGSPSSGKISLPPGPQTSITETKKAQLIRVLQDLDLEEKAGMVPEPRDITVSEFTEDLKLAINEILKGFDPKTRAYIGYPGYKGTFLERHLKDFDAALKLLKAATPNDSQIPDYEAWRPDIEKAVGRSPEELRESQERL